MKYEIKKTYEKKVKKTTKFDIGDIVQYENNDFIYIIKIWRIRISKCWWNVFYADNSWSNDRYTEESLTLITKQK